MKTKFKLFWLVIGFLLTTNSAFSQVSPSELENPNLKGAGTVTNPFRIETARDLDTLSFYMRYQHRKKSPANNKYFKLMNDIDMSVTHALDLNGVDRDRTGRAENFIPIGSRKGAAGYLSVDTVFAGHFDGNGHVIKNLKINSTLDYTGLFGSAAGADIRNLGLVDPIITGTNYVGGISGRNGTFINCYVSGGTISGTGANGCVGGIVGTFGTVANSYVSNSNISGKNNVGGISGGSSSLVKSYSTATINRLASSAATTFGGLCGESSNVTYSYYLDNNDWKGTDGSGNDNWSSVGVTAGISISADEMKDNCTLLTLLGNVITGVWQKANLGENDGFPVLRWEGRGEDASLDADCVSVAFGQGEYSLSTSPPDEDLDPDIGLTADNPYLIATAGDLVLLATFVNNGNNTSDKYFKITENINMSTATDFIPIGGRNAAGTASSTANAFRGYLDGNYKTISNITITNTNGLDYTGFFGYQGAGSLVKNLTLYKITVTSTGGDYTGGFVGKGVNFLNCKVTKGNITSTGDYTGGFAGADGKYQYCSIDSSKINGVNNTGGFIGYSADASTSDCLRCYVANDTIKAPAGKGVGGFAGYAGQENACYVVNSEIIGNLNVGGFLGDLHPASLIQSSYVRGSAVGGTEIFGGFVGTTEHITANLRIRNCYTNATSLGEGASTSTTNGPFRGFNSTSPSLNYSYYEADKWTTGYAGTNGGQATAGSVSRTSTENLTTTATILSSSALNNGANVFIRDSVPIKQDPAPFAPINGGYIILKWQKAIAKNLPADPIGTVTATLHGNAVKIATESNNIRFRYKKATETSWGASVAAATGQDGDNDYRLRVEGLSPNTLYNFQILTVVAGTVVAATNENDIATAPDIFSFTTAAYVIDTTEVTNLGYFKATLNGTLEKISEADNFDLASVYFTYWKAGSNEDIAKKVLVDPSFGDKSFDLTDLDPSTTYNYRLYGKEKGDPNFPEIPGTVTRSAKGTFTTQGINFTTPTSTITELHKATLTGSVSFTGTPPILTDIRFEWWKFGDEANKQSVNVDYSTAGEKSAVITGLRIAEKYAYRMAVTAKDEEIDNAVEVPGAVQEFTAPMFLFPKP